MKIHTNSQFWALCTHVETFLPSKTFVQLHNRKITAGNGSNGCRPTSFELSRPRAPLARLLRSLEIWSLQSHTPLRLSLLTKCQYLYSNIIQKFWTARRPVHLAFGAPILECSSATAPNAALLRTLYHSESQSLNCSSTCSSRPWRANPGMLVCHCSERCSAPNAATSIYHPVTTLASRCHRSERGSEHCHCALPPGPGAKSLFQMPHVPGLPLLCGWATAVAAASRLRTNCIKKVMQGHKASRPLSTPFPVCNNKTDYSWWQPRLVGDYYELR